MAKDTKKRKKKPSQSGSINVKRKEISAIVNYAYQGVRFIGDCETSPRMTGGQKLWTHLRGVDHEIGMEAFLRELFSVKSWSFGVSCAFRHPVNEDLYDIVEATAVIEPVTGAEVSQMIADTINALIETIKETYPDLANRFLYYIYFFEPESIDKERLALKVSGLTDLYIHISDLDIRPLFEQPHPFIQSDQDTIPNGIKDNMTFPKVKIPLYVEIQ